MLCSIGIPSLLKGGCAFRVIIYSCAGGESAVYRRIERIAAIRFCLVRGLMIRLLRTYLCTYEADLLVCVLNLSMRVLTDEIALPYARQFARASFPTARRRFLEDYSHETFPNDGLCIGSCGPSPVCQIRTASALSAALSINF